MPNLHYPFGHALSPHSPVPMYFIERSFPWTCCVVLGDLQIEEGQHHLKATFWNVPHSRHWCMCVLVTRPQGLRISISRVNGVSGPPVHQTGQGVLLSDDSS